MVVTFSALRCVVFITQRIMQRLHKCTCHYESSEEESRLMGDIVAAENGEGKQVKDEKKLASILDADEKHGRSRQMTTHFQPPPLPGRTYTVFGLIYIAIVFVAFFNA